MQRLILLALVLGIALESSAVLAQPFPMENHYKVYIAEGGPSSFPRRFRLDDQFGSNRENLPMSLVNFANPVSKNGSTIFHPQVHYDWWFLPSNIQEPLRTVDLDNQFGRQTWTLRQGPYLLAPAAKSLPPQPPPAPLPPNSANHYRCYNATGPSVNVPVVLVDQFGQMTHTATTPEWFCNPVTKTLDTGEVFPIVNPEAHLACYRLEPRQSLAPAVITVDQFGTWQFRVRGDVLRLCLPTNKLRAIPVKENTWGGVKTLYKD